MESESKGLVVLVALLLCGIAAAVSDSALDFENLKSQYLPSEYSKTNFTLEDAKRLLFKKCKKGGVTDPHIYDHIEKAATKLIKCANQIANLTLILEEIEMARPNGSLDEVFEKYCYRQPEAEKCLNEFNLALLPCLTPAERAQNAIMMRIVSSLLSFICYKSGDQIAMFIAEEGPECLEANKENISNCMNATFSAYMPKNASFSEVTEIPELVIGPQQCIDLYDFEECVLSYVEQCNEITPANIIESIFRYVKNETKCQPDIDKNLQMRLLQKQLDGRSHGMSHQLSYLLIAVLGLFVTSQFLNPFEWL